MEKKPKKNTEAILPFGTEPTKYTQSSASGTWKGTDIGYNIEVAS